MANANLTPRFFGITAESQEIRPLDFPNRRFFHRMMADN
jgi:hypothetical protein